MKKINDTDISNNTCFRKELLSLAIPIGLQNLLVALIGASDALMLGRLAQDAVSAVSLANQIVFIMNMFVAAVVGGGGVLIAQYKGKGDNTMVKNLFSLIIKLSFAISVIFFLLAFFIPQLLMHIYTSDGALIEIGASYLRIVGFSYIFSAITQCYYLVMKIEGKAAKSVVISSLTLTIFSTNVGSGEFIPIRRITIFRAKGSVKDSVCEKRANLRNLSHSLMMKTESRFMRTHCSMPS